MKIFQQTEPTEAVRALTQRISASVVKGKVFWLVCGGSNISLAVMTMNEVRSTGIDLGNLIVGLTDERFGPVGHLDSNWQQLMDAGFNIDGINTIPVLIDKPLDETVGEYARKINQIFIDGTSIIAQLGIGSDGHIAGILPKTMEVSDTQIVRSLEFSPYTRITLTLSALAKIHVAYAFVFGLAKKEIILRLKNENISPTEMPAQILKHLPEAYIYID